jgi:pentatricopeptide repeat protein
MRISAPRHLPIKFLAPLLALLATAALFAVLNRASDPSAPLARDGSGGGFGAGARSAEQQIAMLQRALADGSPTADRYALLGNAYLQRARETADASFYASAGRAFDAGLQLDRSSAAALAGLASLRLAQHDFAAGLRLARRAHALQPGVVRIYGPMVDGLVELGRYGEAERTLQRMIDLKPNLASYARASYIRELHGDLRGATAAMRLAVAAGGDTAENAAYVGVLLGNLELQQGNAARAGHAYRLALARDPGYPPAVAGMARLDWFRNDFEGAIRRLTPLVERIPLPEYAIALAETEQATGRRAAAAEHLALVRVEQRLLARNGVNTDAELAVFDADHGNRDQAVALARRAWAAAPSVRSADALGWALTRSGRAGEGLRWARSALRLGSRDPLFLFHAGIAARNAGETGLAGRLLSRSLAANPRFSPLHAPQARRALEALR